MTAPLPNRFGRQPGRGVRPWILMPKVIAVAFYLGGLAAAIVLWFASGYSTLGAADPRRLLLLNQISVLVRGLVVPALLAAIGFGTLLLFQHPRAFIRMRWLIAKLAAIVIVVPSAHFFLWSRMGLLRSDFAERVTNPAVEKQFGWGLLLTLAASIGIAILGRLKPRLGQNWARSFPATPTPSHE